MGYKVEPKKIEKVLALLQEGFSVRDVEIRSGVSKSAIYCMRKDGRLPAFIEVKKKTKAEKIKKVKAKQEYKSYTLSAEEVAKRYGYPGQYSTKKPVIVLFNHKNDDYSVEFDCLDKSIDNVIKDAVRLN